MTRRDQIKLVVCIALHIFVVWNVYEMSKLTPRLINVVYAEECVEYVPELDDNPELST